MKLISILILIFCSLAQAGSDVGYTYSQSGSSKTHKAKVGLQIFPEHKFSVTYSKTNLNSVDYEDKDNSFLRISYRYRISSDTHLQIDYRKFDESFFFDGHSLGAQFGTKLFSFKEDLDTQLNIKLEAQNKFYSKIKDENFTNSCFDFGLDQELPEGFQIGFDFSVSNYQAKSRLMKEALNGNATILSDLNNYSNTLSKRTVAFFLEFSKDNFSVGTNISQDSPLIETQTKYSTVELYGDLQIQENFSLNASISRGKSVETNSSSSSTTSLGLQYHF